jgi:hypothetical protein
MGLYSCFEDPCRPPGAAQTSTIQDVRFGWATISKISRASHPRRALHTSRPRRAQERPSGFWQASCPSYTEYTCNPLELLGKPPRTPQTFDVPESQRSSDRTMDQRSLPKSAKYKKKWTGPSLGLLLLLRCREKSLRLLFLRLGLVQNDLAPGGDGFGVGQERDADVGGVVHKHALQFRFL